MITFSEMISVFSSFDLGTVLGLATGSAMLPFVASAVSSESDPEPYDAEAVRARIETLEKIKTRTIEQQEELSELYVMSAIALYEDDGELDDILGFFAKAEAVLKQTLAQGEDSEIRRKLGTVYLHRAVTYNDFDDMDHAIECYDEAIETLKPLENAGDGEAKYDVAGIKLNRGSIYHELGEFDKANSDFDEAFLAFRAVEKISDLDTRFYMAKVSIAQGGLYRDTDEPLSKITDAYNRAMRLLVELIDLGQMEHERELANVLMDRCAATYEAYMNQEFESETERLNKFGDVLLDVNRAIEILQKNAAGGEPGARIDLFNAYSTQGAMLLDIEKFAESLPIFERTAKEFAEFAEDTDPILVNQYAAVLENRGFALMNLNRFEEALAEFDKAIACRQRLQDPSFELDDDERKIFVPALATSYANRANAQASLQKLDKAKADCQTGLKLLQSLNAADDEDVAEIESMLRAMLENWS